MFSKIIFVLATVCVVNASVLTVIAFEVDPETQDVNNPKGCNFQECDQLCRRLKFPGGACVNGRCKCDNFLNAEDETENTLSNLEDSVLQRDDPETEVKAKLNRCILKVCDLVCRWLNKTNGSCVDGRCKCANSTVARDAVTGHTLSNLEDYISPRRCTYQACNKLCLSEKSLSNLEDSVSLRKCNHQECNAQCRRLLFREGVCIAGRCSCNNYFPIPDTMDDLEESISLDDNFLITEDEVSDEYSEDQVARGCNIQACDQLCHRLKFPGGTCVNGRCKCDNFFRTEDAGDEYSVFAPRRVCRLAKCSSKCTRRGYEGGSCVDGRCKCFNNLQEKEELILPRACNTVVCNQMCHRLNYAGGWCRLNQCQCY